MTELKDLINQRRTEANAAPTVDWDLRRAKWLASIDEVFHQVEGWLLDAGLANQDISRGARTITEELLGQYTAPTLAIRMPNHTTIIFTPIASVIIGGYGRIDVAPMNGVSRYLLIANDMDEKNRPSGTRSYERDWEWRFYLPHNPRRSLAFDEKGLARVLTELSE